jgi:hypothetical protein
MPKKVSGRETQPTPGAQYNMYQFTTNFEPSGGVNSFCAYETLGVDYWGVYITCTNYRNLVGFVGNTVLAINKAPLLTGAANPQMYWWNDAVKTFLDVSPALTLSPATEEGVQDAEFIVATDAGFGTPSDNLTVCALTNQRNINAVAPTFSCFHTPTTYFYSDPLPARQPAPGAIDPSFGTKQVYYKAGHLFLAWTTGIPGIGDGIFWEVVRPVLQSIDVVNPQTLAYVAFAQLASFVPPAAEDYYTPSIVGTDENDIVLVYNRSGTSTYPGIAYTGSKATDGFNTMGQGGHNAVVVAGTHTVTSPWGKYGACAISLNSVTRGGIWCVGEYTGSVPDPGWNTRLYNLRAE